MCQHAVLFLMPDRPQTQVGFLNSESRLGLRELDVSLPEFFVTPLTHIRAEDVAARTQSRPVAKLRPSSTSVVHVRRPLFPL